MKFTVEQTRYLNDDSEVIYHKGILKNAGEKALYLELQEDYSSGYVCEMTVEEYVEMLKEEIKQENNNTK